MSNARVTKFNKGKWELQRERLRIEDPVPPAPDKGAVSSNQILGELLKKMGLAEDPWFIRLKEEWKSVVGEAVAKHSRPGRLDGMTMVIYVDSPVWLGELSRYSSGQMLANLQARFGAVKVKELRLQLDPGGE